MNTIGIDPGSTRHRQPVPLRKGEVLFVDVRTREEYVGFHLPGAVNVPYDELDLSLEMLRLSGKVAVVYSARGRRSQIAADRLQAYGIPVYDAGTREAAATLLSDGGNA